MAQVWSLKRCELLCKHMLVGYMCLSFILVSQTVLSCSSKTTTRQSPTPEVITSTEKLSLVNTNPTEGVWKIEGDRSLSHPSSQQEELSHSPVNGHNEGLSVPTQDGGISERQPASLPHDDETSDSHHHHHHRTKNNKPLSLVQFSNKSIHCNDRTTAGYYIRKPPTRNSNLWIIFLEGGWYCFDERSCQNRWLRLKNLMSSSSWSHFKHVGGILSSDPNENPYWWNANHVFVPYCSSDTWSGTSKASESGSSFSFMGALIIDEVIKSLVKEKGLTADSTVVLAGSSAGGTGVLINLDRVESLLNEKFGESHVGLPRVRGIADSGWFIDKLPSFSDKVDCHDVILCPPEISLKKGMALWNARLPENCQNSYPDEPWSCFFGYRLYPTLKASLFVFQWMFDEAQMLVNNVPTPALKKEEWDYVYRLGDELKKTLINVTNVFIPACLAHTVLTHRDWKRVEVNSVYLPRALKCWESGGIIEESNVIPSRSHHYWDEEADASLTKGNKKLLRNGNRITPLSSSTGDSSKPSDYPVEVNSNDSSRRGRRRHNRHRQQEQLPDNMTKKERRKYRRRLEQEKRLQKSNPNRRRNIQQLDIKLEPTRQRRRHHERSHQAENTFPNHSNKGKNKHLRSPNARRNNNRNNSSNSSVSSRNNVALRRRDNSDNINHVRSRSKDRRKQRNRRWFSVCDAAESGVNSGGDIRLIEKCSWPQCNKSCPKLLNPITGEEVDFKDLLKSFGLDMGMMAKALGIDLATLNSMDHQVLLQMLTQHA